MSSKPLVNDRLSIESHSAADTEALGRALAELLPDGAVVALRGELASGKTCFVRGMAAAIGEAAAVSSPTFTLVNEYGETKKLYHLDLYRLNRPQEIFDLGYEDFFDLGEGFCAIEWADRVEALLPASRIDVTFEHAGKDKRKIAFNNHSVIEVDWKSILKSATACKRA